MHTSAYSRGASLFGALVLVGILSLVAIGLDSNLKSTPRSQTAVASGPLQAVLNYTSGNCENIDGRSICNGIRRGTDAYENVKCELGNDFIIRLDSDGTDAVVYYADAEGKATNTKSQCSRESAELRVGGRQCTKDSWKCRVKVCFRSSKQGASSGEVVCGPFRTESDKQLELNESVTKSGGVADTAQKRSGTQGAMVSALGSAASEEERAELKAQLDSGDTSASEGILGAYKTALSAREESYIESENNYIARLKELDACRSVSPSIPTNSNLGCEDEWKNLNAAQLERERKSQELEAMSGYAQNLKGAQTSLQPAVDKTISGPPDFCGDSCEKALIKEEDTFGGDTPGGNRTRVLYPDTPTDPFGRFFGLNANQGQDAYCVVSLHPIYVEQYTARPGCHNYRPDAAGGYGGYGSGFGRSNRCGAQPNFGGGLGGIIGGIISLAFNRGGGGDCENGVPKPRCTLTASPTNIQGAGQQVTLSWQSEDAFAASLSSRGSVGVNGSITVQPQETTTYTLSLQGYRNTQTGQVLSGQCSTKVTVGGVGTPTSGDPKAQISCSPQKADVGMSVAVSFSCLNANTSSGSGFSTNNQMSGSATPVVAAPTLGSNSVTYGVTCSKDGKVDSAQCTVDVNTTSIVLIANPKIVEEGEDANIGWVTSGMQSCTISSPELSGFTSENAGNTSTSGVARTPALSDDATFVLTCTSRSGATKTAETKVEVED